MLVERPAGQDAWWPHNVHRDGRIAKLVLCKDGPGPRAPRGGWLSDRIRRSFWVLFRPGPARRGLFRV